MSGPLSNRLADLAERAGEAARAYRRGSIDAIGAYLEAGALLAEARGECRRGEWGAVLARAGIAERTGRLMVQAAKVARELGADAAAVHDAGGVQAFIAAAVAVAVEKPALNAGIEAPEPAGSAPVAHGPAPRRGRTPRRARQSAPPGRREGATAPADAGGAGERWPMRGLRRAGRGPDTVRAVSDSGRGRGGGPAPASGGPSRAPGRDRGGGRGGGRRGPWTVGGGRGAARDRGGGAEATGGEGAIRAGEGAWSVTASVARDVNAVSRTPS